MQKRHTRSFCSLPETAGWWMRLGAAAFFAFYFNFIPLHLATFAHLPDVVSAHSFDHDHDAAGEHHEGDTDHHVPHHASDHALTIAAQAQHAKLVVLLFVIPVATSVAIYEPEEKDECPFFECIKLPTESPPDPLQPRAPPLA